MTPGTLARIVYHIGRRNGPPQNRRENIMTTYKKTKELVKGDLVKNILNGKYYPVASVERWNSGYIVKLDSRDDGCEFYAEYSDRHTVQ